MPLVEVNGVTLHLEQTGSGPPIVFSHGLLFSGAMFDPQVEHLAGRYRCIRYDHRGQGQSPPSPTAYDVETLTDDAAALIEKLGARPCHFVGLSTGGFVGLRLAARKPALLRSLTLIATAADREPRANLPKYRAMSLVARFLGYRPLLGAITKIMFARAFREDPARAELRARMQRGILDLPYAPTDAALRAVTGRNAVEDELARIALPVLHLFGAEDAAIVPARQRRTAAGIAGARAVEIPRGGHTLTIEEPEAVNAALDAFLSPMA